MSILCSYIATVLCKQALYHIHVTLPSLVRFVYVSGPAAACIWPICVETNSPGSFVHM